VQPLRELVYYLPKSFLDDADVETKAKELDRLLDEWVAERDWDEPSDSRASRSTSPTATAGGLTTPDGRSVFDDLLDGRHVDP